MPIKKTCSVDLQTAIDNCLLKPTTQNSGLWKKKDECVTTNRNDDSSTPTRNSQSNLKLLTVGWKQTKPDNEDREYWGSSMQFLGSQLLQSFVGRIANFKHHPDLMIIFKETLQVWRCLRVVFKQCFFNLLYKKTRLFVVVVVVVLIFWFSFWLKIKNAILFNR